MSLLYDHFDDVHQAAISHVVTDENGEHLYLALIRAGSGDPQQGDKQHAGGATPGHKHRTEHTHEHAPAAKVAMPAAPSADPVGSVDDLDVSLSRHLVSLLHSPIMWDACNDKQHCGGAGPAHRPRKKHAEPKVPAGHAHKAASVEEHLAPENGHPATTVSHADVAGIFKVMDSVSAYGLHDEAAAHHDGKATHGGTA